jgi:hypothetical protein
MIHSRHALVDESCTDNGTNRLAVIYEDPILRSIACDVRVHASRAIDTRKARKRRSALHKNKIFADSKSKMLLRHQPTQRA